MALKDYVPEQNLRSAGEDVAESVVKKILLPAGGKFVKDTSNPYDDAAFALVKSFLLELVDDIDKSDNAPE